MKLFLSIGIYLILKSMSDLDGIHTVDQTVAIGSLRIIALVFKR